MAERSCPVCGRRFFQRTGQHRFCTPACRERARGNKKPAAQRIAGLVDSGLLRFREGNGSCVHRHEDLGGGPFCVARCRVVSTHSLPQGGCLRRNLITVFFFVNNPLRFFISLSGVHAGSGRATNGHSRRRGRGVDRTHAHTTVAKNILFYAFEEKREALRAMSRTTSRRCASRVSEGATRVARRPENIFRNDASQHPIRGELRKLSTPSETNPAALGGRIEVPRRARRCVRRPRQWSSASSSSA